MAMHDELIYQSNQRGALHRRNNDPKQIHGFHMSKLKEEDALNLSWSTLSNNMSQLKKKNLVVPKEPCIPSPEGKPKGDYPVTPYRLTFAGLLHALIDILSSHKIEDKVALDRLIKKHADTAPLVFGKWNFFSKECFRTSLTKQHDKNPPIKPHYKRLMFALETTTNPVIRYYVPFPLPEDAPLNMVFEAWFYWPWANDTFDERREWYSKIKKNPEIKKCLETLFKGIIGINIGKAEEMMKYGNIIEADWADESDAK